jgi:hypothetical protein
MSLDAIAMPSSSLSFEEPEDSCLRWGKSQQPTVAPTCTTFGHRGSSLLLWCAMFSSFSRSFATAALRPGSSGGAKSSGAALPPPCHNTKHTPTAQSTKVPVRCTNDVSSRSLGWQDYRGTCTMHTDLRFTGGLYCVSVQLGGETEDRQLHLQGTTALFQSITVR